MFELRNVMRTFDDFDDMGDKKKAKFINTLFHDNDFMQYLFDPAKNENTESEIVALYQAVTQPTVIKAMYETIQDTGYSEYDRSVATFINSICNQAILYNNEILEDAASKKRSGDLTNREYTQFSEKCEKYNGYIAELLKCSRKIVKPIAKDLCAETGIPRYVCTIALRSAPETKYIKTYKVPYYLSNILNNIYSEVDKMGDFSENVNWRPFFKTVFGKDNVIEAATFILLEGVHRIDKYENSKDVHACWDSLTSFALKELNDSPDQLRNQMIEIYIKRISKMFANHAFDLRVDLLNIDKNTFPKLASSVSNYADKIQSIINGSKPKDE